jgi:hypothetical protein
MRQMGVPADTPHAIIAQKKKQPERSAEGPRHSG